MQKSLALRIFRTHGFWLKLGPQIGGRIIKAYAYFALYKIFTAGGVEALSHVAYLHMLREGEAEHLELTKAKRAKEKIRRGA